jgi:hypothetical protein
MGPVLNVLARISSNLLDWTGWVSTAVECLDDNPVAFQNIFLTKLVIYEYISIWIYWFLIYFPYLKKSRFTPSPWCLCIPPINFWLPESILMKLGFYYHGIWAHFNVELRKFISSVSVASCASFSSLLRNSWVNTFPWQGIHTTIEEMLHECVCWSVIVSPYRCYVTTR